VSINSEIHGNFINLNIQCRLLESFIGANRNTYRREHVYVYVKHVLEQLNCKDNQSNRRLMDNKTRRRLPCRQPPHLALEYMPSTGRAGASAAHQALSQIANGSTLWARTFGTTFQLNNTCYIFDLNIPIPFYVNTRSARCTGKEKRRCLMLPSHRQESLHACKQGHLQHKFGVLLYT